MRRGMVVIAVGLALAFGVFYWLGWPSTLTAAPGNEQGFEGVRPDEVLYVGTNLFEVTGRREVVISTTRLNEASPGIVLVGILVNRVGDRGLEPLGALRGSHPDYDALPRAAGSILKPGVRGQFIVVLRISSMGMYRASGVRVLYRSGWLTRTATLGPRFEIGSAASPAPAPSPTQS